MMNPSAPKGRWKALTVAAVCTLIQFGSLNRILVYLSTGTLI